MALKELCAEHWLKELKESMDRCTCHYDITEILLKTALKTKQSTQTLYQIPKFSLTKLKAFADDKINLAEKWKLVFRRVQNIVLVTRIFSFSHNVFKSLLIQVC